MRSQMLLGSLIVALVLSGALAQPAPAGNAPATRPSGASATTRPAATRPAATRPAAAAPATRPVNSFDYSNFDQSKYPPRKRRVDCFLGIHFDLHANDNCREIGRNVTREMVDNILTSVKPDYIQVVC
ncbi:MAG: hypothetical protein NTU94_04235 [Planctomycetota bacterium]|nr:hypothetical protein [Planctomycetota bacterium]